MNYNLTKTQLTDNPHCRLTIICEGQRGGAAKHTYYAIAMRYLTTQTRQLKNSSDKRCENKNKAEDAKHKSSNMW